MHERESGTVMQHTLARAEEERGCCLIGELLCRNHSVGASAISACGDHVPWHESWPDVNWMPRDPPHSPPFLRGAAQVEEGGVLEVAPGTILEVTEAWYGGGRSRQREKKSKDEDAEQELWVDVTDMVRLLVRDGGIEPLRVSNRLLGVGRVHGGRKSAAAKRGRRAGSTDDDARLLVEEEDGSADEDGTQLRRLIVCYVPKVCLLRLMRTLAPPPATHS